MTPFLQVQLPDGGPIYAETDITRFIVEPWNTASAILFIFICLFWLFRLKGSYVKFSFMTIATVILTIGAVGGTLYHAFRSSSVYLYMDWLPIMILCIMGGGYFILKVFGKWYVMVFAVLIAFVLQFALFRFFRPEIAINVSYGIMGAWILVPTLLAMLNTQFYHWWNVVYSLAAFLLALTFRILDPYELIPMGTHFLWHVFGAFACHYIFKYIYELKRKELEFIDNQIIVH